MNLDELVKLLPKLNKEHLKCFWNAYNNKWIPNSPELSCLIEKGLLKVSLKKDISRLEGYFSKNNIEKIKDKKEFIFKYLPNTKGLENGKKAAYEDLLNYIQKNHTYCFEEFLTEFNNYTFGDIVEGDGYELLHYVAERVDYVLAYNLETWHIINNNRVSSKTSQTQTQKQSPNENEQKIIKFCQKFIIIMFALICWRITIPCAIIYFIYKFFRERGKA